MTVRHGWLSVARRTEVRVHAAALLRACTAIGGRRSGWRAIARRQVGFVTRLHARRTAAGSPMRRRGPAQVALEPAQRRTLEVGSYVVLGGLGLGLQAGGWPAWSALAAAAAYAGWVVLYAEVTVQAKAHPEILMRLAPRGRLHLRGGEDLPSASGSAPQPAEEQSPA